MVEVGKNSKVKAGDTAVLIGKSKNKILRTEELAANCKTIAHEIVCAINEKVKKVYL